MSKGRILAVDDEREMLTSIDKSLTRAGYEVITANSAEAALVRLQDRQRPDLVITDIAMPGAGGIELLKRVGKNHPEVPVILITAHATMANAVEAMRRGAYDYLPKPFSADQLLVAVERAFGHQDLRRENRRLRAQLGVTGEEDPSGIVGASPAIMEIKRLLQRVGPTDLSVLITGESGTGKEVVAKAIHNLSQRAKRPFIPVDCAAIPGNLMESELFGHIKGAFTGANRDRKGLVESAQEGTFFLDEIGELELGVQVKLLRLLQERQVRRVGGTRTKKVDIRVIAATNRDLDEAVREGTFREDLFHRLNVVHIVLPPLRQRRDDIITLLDHFLGQLATLQGRDPISCSPEVSEALRYRYDWPGNVRELHNCARYVAGLTVGDTVHISDLPPRIRRAVEGDHTPVSQPASVPAAAPTEGAVESSGSLPPIRYDLSYKQAKRLWMEVFEVAYITNLLQLHGGNISQAARAAGIDRKSIQRLLKRNNMAEGE